MQYATRLDIVQTLYLITLICLDKRLTTVTLTEIHLTLHIMEINCHRLCGLQEGVLTSRASMTSMTSRTSLTSKGELQYSFLFL